MSEPPTNKRRRVVPQELRKRSERSCDQCRKRRGKCEPSPNGPDCTACSVHQTACTYEAPRRSRFQGSISDLSDRYRCLDAIVRGAFPGEAATTVPELLRLGAKHGFSMPDVSGLPTLPEQELLAPGQATPDASGQPISLGLADDPNVLPAPASGDRDSPGFVRDSLGQPHHIGPTGSLAFYASLRHLISSRFKCTSGDRRASFAHDTAATTLESEAGREDQPEIASPDSLVTVERVTSQPDMTEEQGKLPETLKMNELIQAYFEHVHLDFPLFHRASFEEEYECFILALRSGRPITSSYIPFPDSGWGWLTCLYMILVFGSLTGNEPHGASARALRRQAVSFARSQLSILSTKSSLWNVRALVLLSLYLHNNSERNAAYLISGTAVRCALALGLHRRDLDSSFRPIEREMRKRAFCSLYAYEQFLCSTLGRPSGMGDPDMEVTAPKEGFLYNGNTIAELSAASIDLQKILFKTRWASVSQTNILEYLRAWKQRLPDFLNIPRCVSMSDVSTRSSSTSQQPDLSLRTIMSHQPPPRVRSVLLLHIQYHYIAALSTRAALLHAVASSHNPLVPVPPGFKETSTETAEACVYHAAQIAALITLLHDFSLLQGESALDIFYGYSAGMLLILRLLQQPTEAARSLLERERQIKIFVRRTTDKLRNDIRSTSKSSTMARFASVLESFASLPTIGEDSSTITHTNDPGHSNVSQNSIPTNGAAAVAGTNVLIGLSNNFTAAGFDATTHDATPLSTGNLHDLTAYTLQNQNTLEELPHLPTDFSWSAFGNDLDLGWADFEGLLNGNGLFAPTTE